MVFVCCANEANKEGSRTATNVGSKQTKGNAVESEFVSDAFQTTDKDLDEVKAGMKLLGIDSLTNQSHKNDGKRPCFETAVTFMPLQTNDGAI